MFDVAGRHTFFLPVDTAFDVSKIAIVSDAGFDWIYLFGIYYLSYRVTIQGNCTWL